MSIKGIIFNGKHSYHDMNISMTGERKIGYPRKRKIKVAPPYSNQVHDFSELYGDQVYEERPLYYQFNIINFHDLSIERVEHLSTVIVNWLMNSNGKQKLIDPYIPGYYFMAEVEGDIDLNHLVHYGILDVSFIAYPFKISELPEGHDIWDEFNFELDIAQILKHTVNGTKTITLFNTGTPSVVPTVITSAPFKVTINNVEYSFSSGTSKDENFRLSSGEHKVTLQGNGNIEFIFHKELI